MLTLILLKKTRGLLDRAWDLTGLTMSELRQAAAPAVPAPVAPAALFAPPAAPVAVCDVRNDLPTLISAPAAPVAARATPWIINGENVGMYVPAEEIFSTLSGFEHLDLEKLKGLMIRVGTNGKFVFSDMVAALLCCDRGTARTFANNPKYVNVALYPSLTRIESGHSQVTLLELT